MTEPNYSRIDAAIGAKALIDSKAFNDSFAAVRQTLLESIEALPISHPESARAAEDFRMSLKLLKSIRSALETAINSGKVEQSFITEIEAYRKNPRKGIFR
jgi:phosphoribosylformylglycinamidine (FGAM) synthase-like enzyme